MQIRGFYGTGCTAEEPAVTCEVGVQSGTCLQQMIDTRITQDKHSLAIGDKCINITRDFNKLYVDIPGKPLVTTECESEVYNFYDVMHCMVPDKIPKRPY